jgi:PST family polysaccharide transporter
MTAVRRGARLRRRLGFWGLDPVAQNALALSVMQVATFLFPLIQVPYLARVLGASSWGLVAFAQAFAVLILLLLQYGFDLSATRDIARGRHEHARVSDAVARVASAQGALVLVSTTVAFATYWFVPTFHEHPLHLALGWLLGVGYGLSPIWYFRGIERVGTAMLIDIAGKAVGTAGIFLFVHNPSHGWLALAIQAGATVMTTAIAVCLMYRNVAARWPRARAAKRTLIEGWNLFLFRGSVNLYLSGGAFILGLFAPVSEVAYFAGADRGSKAGVGLMTALSQALYPRMVLLTETNPEQAARLAWISMAFVGAFAVVLAMGLATLAPVIIPLLLGSGFESAVLVLQILALLMPLIAVHDVLGTQWMLPLGLDRPFAAIVTIAAALNVVLAALLAPPFGALGMAWAVVASQGFVATAIFLMLWRTKRLPALRDRRAA